MKKKHLCISKRHKAVEEVSVKKEYNLVVTTYFIGKSVVTDSRIIANTLIWLSEKTKWQIHNINLHPDDVKTIVGPGSYTIRFRYSTCYRHYDDKLNLVVIDKGRW